MFLQDCFNKTQVQMNWYHQENPPLPTDTNTNTDTDTDTDTDTYPNSCNNSKHRKSHTKKGSWYPEKPMLNPPSHKYGTPPTIVSNVLRSNENSMTLQPMISLPAQTTQTPTGSVSLTLRAVQQATTIGTTSSFTTVETNGISHELSIPPRWHYNML